MEIEDVFSYEFIDIAARKATSDDYWILKPEFLERLDSRGFTFKSKSRQEPFFSMQVLSQLREAEPYGLWVFTVRDEDNFKLIAKKKRSMR
tara:strand:+ start:120 stop:392 length:273 start_codon:yes stop_codon:yes gene_type:complete